MSLILYDKVAPSVRQNDKINFNLSDRISMHHHTKVKSTLISSDVVPISSDRVTFSSEIITIYMLLHLRNSRINQKTFFALPAD